MPQFPISSPSLNFWKFNFCTWYPIYRCFSLFDTLFLLLSQVPIASGSGSYPFSIDVPRNTRFLFSSKVVTPATAIAKSIVSMLVPRVSTNLFSFPLMIFEYFHVACILHFSVHSFLRINHCRYIF